MSQSKNGPVILGIDPGNTESAFVEYVPTDSAIPGKLRSVDTLPNPEMLQLLKKHTSSDIVAIETPFPRGMPMSWQTIETVLWIGRFELVSPLASVRVDRKAVKLHVCNRTSSRDSNVRQSLIDLWGGDRLAIGGKKCPKCKGKGWFGRGRPPCPRCEAGELPEGEYSWEVPPGPLVDVANDEWQALAVAVTYGAMGEEALVPPMQVKREKKRQEDE